MKLKMEMMNQQISAEADTAAKSLKESFINNGDTCGVGSKSQVSNHADLSDKTGFKMSGEVKKISSEDNNDVKTPEGHKLQNLISNIASATDVTSPDCEFDAVADAIGASKAGQNKAFGIEKSMNNKANPVLPVFFVIIALFLLIIRYTYLNGRYDGREACYEA